MRPLYEVQTDYDQYCTMVLSNVAERDRLNSILAERIAQRDAYQEELQDTKLWTTITPEEWDVVSSMPPEDKEQEYHAWYARVQWSSLDCVRFRCLLGLYQRRGTAWCVPSIPTVIELYRKLLRIVEKLTGRKDIAYVHLNMNQILYGIGPQGADEVYHVLYVNGEPAHWVDFAGHTTAADISYPALLPYRNDYIQTVLALEKAVLGGQ